MRRVFPLLLLLALLLAGCQGEAAPAVSYDLDQVPAYAGEPYVVINDNQPFFGEEEYTTEAFETYSALDGLGRCGTAYACVGEELMPAGERESISSVKPSGWINVEYGGQYLYNRCHLIGFQLTGENANERNLITGTRYMNVEGMLPFENLVADYVKETSNHVLYRVTPLYEGDNLVASGVLMEAGSVEDEREGICFNVYVYNVQPGIGIDYATGASWAEGEQGEIQSSPTPAGTAYVLNTNTKKFHLPTCASVEDMKPENRTDYTGSREALLDEGYSPCGQCKPKSKTAAEPRSAAVFQRPNRKNRARNRAQDRMGKRTSTGRRRRGWLHVRGARPSKPLDSMAMDSSSDQRTDLTSRGLRRAGETGKTRMPRAAKAARVRLYSSIILGRMPQAASRP